MLIKRVHHLTLCAIMACTLAACGGTSSSNGPRVFPQGSAVTGLEELRFGSSCSHLHASLTDRLPASESTYKPGSNFYFDTSYPMLGSSTVFFRCAPDNTLSSVLIRLSSPLRDYQPYERSLGRLKDLWGEPARERTRREQSPNAASIRALGGSPDTYELHTATWLHEQKGEAELDMRFGFREIELNLTFKQRE